MTGSLLPAISTTAILGYVISEARRVAGVKQDTVRAALLVGAGTLSRYEAGLRAPDERGLLRIEDCLSLPHGTLKRRALSVESALQTFALVVDTPVYVDQRPVIQRILTCVATNDSDL